MTFATSAASKVDVALKLMKIGSTVGPISAVSITTLEGVRSLCTIERPPTTTVVPEPNNGLSFTVKFQMAGSLDVAFDVSVVVPGQTLSPVFAGDTVNVSILAGQSIELDASEPAIWNFTVNDSPLFGSGTTVVVGGLSIVQSDLTPSRVVIDTALIGPTVLPIFINLSATSTFDAAEVANVTLEIQ